MALFIVIGVVLLSYAIILGYWILKIRAQVNLFNNNKTIVEVPIKHETTEVINNVTIDITPMILEQQKLNEQIISELDLFKDYLSTMQINVKLEVDNPNVKVKNTEVKFLNSLNKSYENIPTLSK